jgi:hypothetical protein
VIVLGLAETTPLLGAQLQHKPLMERSVKNSASWDSAPILSDGEGQWWDGFGSASERGLNGGVGALTDYQGDVIAGGVFTTAGGLEVDRIARWDGTTWHALGGGVDPCLVVCNGTVVLALAVHGSDLIVGGSFRAVDDGKPAPYVARWDGSTWHAMGGGFDDQVNALLVWRGLVIAGGRFRNADGRRVDRIAQWDGTSWSPLHTGLNAAVHTLVEFEGDLVAAGAFSHAGVLEVNGIARWDGNWHALGEGTGSSIGAVVFDSTLIAEGLFRLESGLGSFLGRWNGTSWEAIVAPPYLPLVLGVCNGKLVIGGDFSDSRYGSYITRWDGETWSTLGSGLNERPLALLGVESHLYVGGIFTVAGGIPSARIARWDETITAVEVSDFRAHAVAGAVELAWSLSADTLREIAAVHVERAREASGPFTLRTEKPLPAAPSMSFRDPVAGSGTQWWYRLALLEATGGQVVVGPVRITVPDGGTLQTSLDPPEGARGWVRIRYRIGSTANVLLGAYDVRGRLLRIVDSGVRPAGEHVRLWDRVDQNGVRAPRGVYVLHLRAGRVQASRKLVLLED